MKKAIIMMFMLLFTAMPCWAQEPIEETIEGKNAAQWQLTGIVYASNNQFELAIDAMSKAIQLKPQAPGVYNNRGRVYYGFGNFDKAIEDFDRAIDISNKDSMTFNNRGDAYYAKQDYNKSLADYSSALALEPQPSRESYRAMYGRASSLDGLKNKKEAIKAYQEFLKVAPADNPNRAKAQQRLNALK